MNAIAETSSADPADYLRIEPFIRTIVDARSLKTAFEIGLIQRLRNSDSMGIKELQSGTGVDAAGISLLLGLLRSNSVVFVNSDNAVRLTDPFRAALKYQDLLEAKIHFAELVAPDFLHLFTALLHDPARFMREARLFKLFDYRRCLEFTLENEQATRRWMALTTALTRYEAGVCLHYFDFAPVKRMLDIGGNSGEFALQICRRFPRIETTVFDLPLVCRIGREHVGAFPEAARIRFVEGNALSDTLPAGADLITFKSMLHDWPDPLADDLLARATRSLAPGGTLLIFERSALEVGSSGIPYSLIPMLLFFRSFRSHRFYEQKLAQLGYQDVQTRRIELETPFILVTARKLS